MVDLSLVVVTRSVLFLRSPMWVVNIEKHFAQVTRSILRYGYLVQLIKHALFIELINCGKGLMQNIKIK